MIAKNFIFTLNNPTAAEKLFFTGLEDVNVRTEYDIGFIAFQLEKAPETGTIHYQGYVQFTKKKRLPSVKSLISRRAHVEIARGTADECITYNTKEESRIEGPWQYGEPKSQGRRTDIVDFVRRAALGPITEQETIEEWGPILAKYPRFVSRVTRFYQTPTRPLFVPRPGWQFELSLILNGEPHPRRVYWYQEAIGNVGKTYFGLNFVDCRGYGGYVVTGGRHADIYYAYQNEKVVFFDWARDNEDAFPYRVVETFKNGYFLNTKYETNCHRFPIPHVVVFANFKPDESKLSADRWAIKNI